MTRSKPNNLFCSCQHHYQQLYAPSEACRRDSEYGEGKTAALQENGSGRSRLHVPSTIGELVIKWPITCLDEHQTDQGYIASSHFASIELQLSLDTLLLSFRSSCHLNWVALILDCAGGPNFTRLSASSSSFRSRCRLILPTAYPCSALHCSPILIISPSRRHLLSGPSPPAAHKQLRSTIQHQAYQPLISHVRQSFCASQPSNVQRPLACVDQG